MVFIGYSCVLLVLIGLAVTRCRACVLLFRQPFLTLSSLSLLPPSFPPIGKIKKAEKSLEALLDRPPTAAEISEVVRMSRDKVEAVIAAYKSPLYMDAPMKDADGGSESIASTIEDNGELPEDTAVSLLLREDLDNVLDTLNERESGILRMRYGLMPDGQARTLDEIGRHFNVTRERIRQIEMKAMRKLRQPARQSLLRDYADLDSDMRVNRASRGVRRK